MQCRLGGGRPYFICPGIVNGNICSRWVTKLYGADTHFLCRHCYRLAYSSQRENRSDRALRRANKLRMRLGGEPGMVSAFPPRPKSMHYQTYKRLQSAAANAEILAQERLVVAVARLLPGSDRRNGRRSAGRPIKEFWT
jgi:cytosine/adenosine deaminase-related metal-dependent hydrolase